MAIQVLRFIEHISVVCIVHRYKEQKESMEKIVREREEFAKRLLVLVVRARRQAQKPPSKYQTDTELRRWSVTNYGAVSVKLCLFRCA